MRKVAGCKVLNLYSLPRVSASLLSAFLSTMHSQQSTQIPPQGHSISSRLTRLLLRSIT
jgi:hypothetical protein